jgi:hypothetical protein
MRFGGVLVSGNLRSRSASWYNLGLSIYNERVSTFANITLKKHQ